MSAAVGLPVPCVVGPTATGKSEVADAVAQILGSAVISADAMQVYKGMDIGTAKVPPEERSVPLLMVDVVPVGEAYSAALYQREAREALDALLARGLVPVVCGGTGLYVKALIDEMDLPRGEGGSPSRRRWEAHLAAHGEQSLWEELRRRDARSADAIHPHNSRRVVRALEMADEGVSYAEQASGLHEPKARYDARLWGLARERARLYAAIDARVDAMVGNGLVDEVERLMGEGLLEAPTASQAIGYKEIAAYLRGEMGLDAALDAMKRRSRRLAKRQFTWFRRDSRVTWLDVDELGSDAIVERIVSDVAKERP